MEKLHLSFLPWFSHVVTESLTLPQLQHEGSLSTVKDVYKNLLLDPPSPHDDHRLFISSLNDDLEDVTCSVGGIIC